VLFLGSAAILVGMWMERFVIIVTSLNRDFLTSSWHFYLPTWVDWGLLAGSVGLFGFLFLLFVRFVPSVAISEVKSLGSELALTVTEGVAGTAGRHA
jgi:molybdopterin-containing oxidoreductase family membrane subunit